MSTDGDRGRKGIRRIVAIALVTIGGSGVVRGQEEPAPAQEAKPSFNLTLGLGEMWDTNVEFADVGSSATGDLITRPTLKVEWLHETPRLNLTLFGGGGGAVYREVSDLDHFNYLVGTSGTYVMSARSSIRFGETFNTAYAHDVPLLAESGLVLPVVLTHSNLATGDLVYKTSEHTTATISARQESYDFNTTGLTSGSIVGLGPSLAWQATARDNFSISYLYRWSTALSGRTDQLQTLLATWTGTLTPQLKLALGLGGSHLQPGDGTPAPGLQPEGAATLTYSAKQSSFSAGYSRTLSQAFGLGREREVDLIAAHYARNLTRSLVATAGFAYGWNHDPLDPTFRLNSQNRDFELRYALRPRLSLGSSYSYRRNDFTVPALPVTGTRITLDLGYGVTWR
jgi:hypothetical protein